jgi:alpha-D-ribose 1-methylphosphonate 5-triphosphate synthase subunit PhnH
MITLAAFSGGLPPAFADPVFDSQRCFRSILDAMSHPGSVQAMAVDLVPPPPLRPSTAAIALTLLDFETHIWTDLPETSEAALWLRFHCGCKWENKAAAQFALITCPDPLPALETFYAGHEDSPGNSATLIVQVEDFQPGGSKVFKGPGIAGENRLDIAGLPEEFWDFWKHNRRFYPLGVDVIFSAGRKCVGLPRTTAVEW